MWVSLVHGYVQFKFASQSFSQLVKLSQNLNPKFSVKGLQGQSNFSYEHYIMEIEMS